MFRGSVSCQRTQSSLQTPAMAEAIHLNCFVALRTPRNDRIKFIFLILLFFIFFHLKNCFAEPIDPTRPANYATPSQTIDITKLTLDSVIIGTTRRLAIINGQTVQTGDNIAGYEVLEIQRNAVRLLGPNGAFVLPLLAQNVKSPAKSELAK